ncbi:MAG TPA: biotin transporter BioY [Gaiellaceae bacterium]|nr:biotin transporter BioY [Gaiellaceae bacterium]
MAVVVGALLIAAAAQISIPLGFTPVPITGQTFAVLLVGAGLGPLAGATSVLLYVIAGGLGAPVYASHAHGWSVISSASGGYLVGFIAAAALTGALAQHRWDRQFPSSVAVMLTGNVVIYAFGITWLAHDLHLSTQKALEYGLYPFILGDLIKLYLAATALPAAWRWARPR